MPLAKSSVSTVVGKRSAGAPPRSRFGRFAICAAILAQPAVAMPAPATTASSSPAWEVAPAAIATREIRFSSHGVMLTGTLSYPAGATRAPAIVVTHGAEAPTRDFGLYRHLEQDLPRLGYATFVYDRRGSGASAGDIEESDYQILADDAVAAQQAIAADPHVDRHRIGFWGLSQGGWLAALAAMRSPDAAFVISISAPLQTPAEQMAFAVSNILATKGFGADDIAHAIATRHAVEDYLRGRESTADAQAALDKAKDKPWFDDIFMGATVSGHPEQSRWRKEMDYDPSLPLKALKIPVLVLFGSDDPWVPVRASLDQFHLLTPNHRNIDVEVVPGADHMMMPPPTTNPMGYDAKTLKAEAPSTPAYFLILSTWLARNVALPSRAR